MQEQYMIEVHITRLGDIIQELEPIRLGADNESLDVTLQTLNRRVEDAISADQDCSHDNTSIQYGSLDESNVWCEDCYRDVTRELIERWEDAKAEIQK